MAQSATTVTARNPTPPTKLSYVGNRPPLDPGQAVVDDGIPYWLSGGVLSNFMSMNETASSEVNSLRVVFAAKTAAASTAGAPGAGISDDHEGKGNETLFTATYNTPQILVPVTLQTVGCGPALPAPAVGTASMPIPNQLHASSLSPATNPTLTSLGTTSTASGTGTVSQTVTGTGFTPQSVIYVNGVAQTTTFTSATSLTAPTVTKKATAGTWPVTVVTGGVVTTAAQTWTFT